MAAPSALLPASRFVDLSNLCNSDWGEPVRAEPDNHLRVSMMFQSLTKEEARAAWAPLIDFANAHGSEGFDSAI